MTSEPRDRARPGAEGRPRGQALVEFALAIPVVLLLFMAIFDLGTAVFSYNSLTNAAREGARLAIVNQDEASIIQRAKDQLFVAEINAPDVTIGFYRANPDGTPNTGEECDPVAVGCLAVVTFETTYQPLTPIISQIVFSGGVTFTASSTLTVEFTCPNATLTAANCPRQP
jgi:Flp pilus assembly protein TadG